MKNTQGSVVKYGQLPDSGKADGLYILSTAFAATIFNHAARQSQRECWMEPSRLFSKSRKCSLWERYWIPIAIGITVGAISALPAGATGEARAGRPSNQSPGDDAMKKKRRKKKRRGLRL